MKEWMGCGHRCGRGDGSDVRSRREQTHKVQDLAGHINKDEELEGDLAYTGKGKVEKMIANADHVYISLSLSPA